MPAPDTTLPPQYFDDIYRANPDPWAFASSSYEAEKYAATLAALPRGQYENAYEIGCSIGVLSARLAPRCTRLLSVDASELPLAEARKRLASFEHVRVEQQVVPADLPGETFDLIVLSEVGYYLSWADLAALREGLLARLRPGGHLVLVHWTPMVPDYPRTGDEVHDFFAEKTGPAQPLVHQAGHRAERYRLDVFERR
jgi:SAM-dependent methyltransferase